MNVYTTFEHKPIWFNHPCDIIACQCPSSLKAAFDKIERWLDAGFYVAGFLSYEAGYCFEPRLCPQPKYDFPLLRMAAYARPDSSKKTPDGGGPFRVSRLVLSADFNHYASKIRRIRSYIAAGDVYQITRVRHNSLN
jgi:hypothetical protein